MTVVDASAVVDLLVPPDAGRRDFLVAQLPEPSAPWLAPDVLLFEVFAVIRRHVLRRVLSEPAAAIAERGLDSRDQVELAHEDGISRARRCHRRHSRSRSHFRSRSCSSESLL